MKNVHVIPTEKPSRLYSLEELRIGDSSIRPTHLGMFNQHIYITSDEEIKDGDWVISNLNELTTFRSLYCQNEYRKIILTTDQDLIADGVQAIDNEFLEWFVKNPSCESVEVHKNPFYEESNYKHYKIIIPQEEPKQLTDLEFAVKLEEIKREGRELERLKDIELEEVFGSSHCQFSVIENSLAKLYRNQEKILKAIKLLRNDD
jgi:hypothetical protein